MMVVPSRESPRAQPYLAPSNPTKPRFFVENERFREIEKRKQIAELKLAAYDKAKADFIGYADANNTAAVYNRDKTIAAFQALLASGGADRIAGVIKGMAYIDDMSMNMSGKLFANSGGPEMDEPAVISDWNGHKDIYNNLNAADKALLDEFRANIQSGQLSSANYQSMKAAAVEVLKKKELYHESIIRYNWAYGIGYPMVVSGGALFGIAAGFFAASAAAAASFFGGFMAPVFAALGAQHWGWGAGLMAAGLGMIIPATIDMNNKDNDHNSANRNADDQRNAIVNKLNTIKAKEEEYLQAKAALDYFTKAPSQAVLKDRLHQWGASVGGYTLTDADLRYIKDDKSNYVDSTGTTYVAGAHCPPTGNCLNDAGRVLNITSSITTPKFETAAGDKYDPSQVTTQNLESTLEGGFYWLNGDKYVKIKQMAHTGQMTDAYAKYVTADIAPGGNWDMYSLGDVMNMTSNHSDVLRSQLKQGYFDAATNGGHENTLMLNERDKTMWAIWDYADLQGKQYKGFQIMAGDYQENSTNVFQVQQQQNASLVTQQWALRRAELDAARARWENLANTIESRGMESFNASEQKFLKAWRQWEIDTNRKIDSGKKQWDDKIKTFLTSKQEWQDDIKAAAMEQSLEKMLGATGSALNERLKALSAGIDIPVDVPEINVANLVQTAMADFERSKPSNERLFGEINKSITAFNVTLELGNATHFKGFNSTSLEGDFTSNMETFAKKMSILNNVKMYESFKKLIEDFKESLRKNDHNITSGLTTAATLANYRENGGWYAKDMGWAFGGKYAFSAYQHADVDGLMNRGMREAGMTIMSGDEMVGFLEKGRDVDVKLFFEVQTMALENAFKIVGGDKSKKGLYGEWVGEAPEYNKDGDESSQGSGELGGWAGGQMDNKKTYRGLNKEEKRLASIQGSINAAIGLTGGLAAAATGNVWAMAMVAGTQATYSTASNIAMGRDVGGTLAAGAMDFGIAFGGAMMGPGVGAQLLRGGMSMARGGIGTNADGSLNFDFKGNLSRGGAASIAFSTTMSIVGDSVGGGVGAASGSKGWGALASGAFDAIGSGVKFDSGGISGFSWGAAAGSAVTSTLAYGLNPQNSSNKSFFSGGMENQVLASEVGRAAGALTTALVGSATNDYGASQNFTNAYGQQNGFSTLGGILGRQLNASMQERAAQRQAQESGTGGAAAGLIGGAAGQVALRRREWYEEIGDMASNALSAAGQGLSWLDNTLTSGVNSIGGMIGSGLVAGAGAMQSGLAGVLGSFGWESGSNAVKGYGYQTNQSLYSFATSPTLMAAGAEAGMSMGEALRQSKEKQEMFENLRKEGLIDTNGQLVNKESVVGKILSTIGGGIADAVKWLGGATSWLGGQIADTAERSFNAVLNRGYKTGAELENMKTYQAMKAKLGITREDLQGDMLTTWYYKGKGSNNEELWAYERSQLTLAEINNFNSVNDDEGMWTKLGNKVSKWWNGNQGDASPIKTRGPTGYDSIIGFKANRNNGLVRVIEGTIEEVWKNFSSPEAAAGSLGEIANYGQSNPDARTPEQVGGIVADRGISFASSQSVEAGKKVAKVTFENGGFSKGEVFGAAITAVIGAVAYAVAKPTETRELIETTKISAGFGTQIGDSPYFTQGGNLQLNISASLREALTSIVFSTGFLTDNTKDIKQPVDPRIRPADPRLAPYLPLMNKKLEYGTNLGGGNAVGYPRGY